MAGMKIDQNVLAKRICELEGQKVNLSIAQVKEVLRITLDMLANDYELWQVVRLLRSHER